MKIKELKKNPSIDQHKKLFLLYTQFNNLLSILNTKELTEEIVIVINHKIDELHSASNSEKELKTQLKKTQSSVLKLIEKEAKLVTKNHYRNTWLAIGMSVFGIPIGVALGVSLGNIGLLGIGLPLGMVIGMAVGTKMDEKARELGKQLDIEIKY